MALLKLQIITPDGIAYDGEALSVTLPTVEGEIGLLPGHQPITTALVAGELDVVHPQRGEESLAVDRGFAQLTGNHVAVLTEAAIDVRAVDPAVLEEARTRAAAALEAARKNQDIDPEAFEELAGNLQFVTAQLEVRQKGRRSSRSH